MKSTRTQLDKNKVTVRLIELILNMSEADQRNLLKVIENRISQKKTDPKDKRKHPRKTALISVECATESVSFTDTILDISNGGVFIETDAPFDIGQEIIMDFSLPESESPVSVRGEIVRVDPNGVGVKFINGDVNMMNL
jgi:Tfp pilus assembly protein PilZ